MLTSPRSRGLLLALSLGVMACAATPPAPAPPLAQPATVAPHLTVHPVAPGVWVVTDEQPWPANSLLAELDDGTLLFVDTPYTPAQTERLIAWARGRFGAERPLVAINTHFHPDALGGNPALLAAGARVYTSDLTEVALRERGENTRVVLLQALQGRPAARAALEASPWVAGSQRFSAREGSTLRFGADEVEIFYPGAAHAPDNVVVWLPRHRVLFGGCMVRATAEVGNRSDADLPSWREAARALQARYQPRVVVAGHGGWGGAELLQIALDAVEGGLGLPPAARGQ